jgi:putative nucleotidyltransferase with HDIG domain
MASTRERRKPGPLSGAARALSVRLLADEPTRLDHSAGVARAATYAAERLPEVSVDLVVAAAWLHDIGHAAALSGSGFHPLDGAIYLRRLGWDEEVVRLVAHHSHNVVSAQAFGFSQDLMQFMPTAGIVADTLTFADIIAGPDGRGAPVSALGYGLNDRPDEVDPRLVELARQRLILLEESITVVCTALNSDLSASSLSV